MNDSFTNPKENQENYQKANQESKKYNDEKISNEYKDNDVSIDETSEFETEDKVNISHFTLHLQFKLNLKICI